jgi:hypothetical protein
MKSLVLHVGIPKTGSSALQVFCAQNREAMLAQSLDYFELGEFALGAHGKISAGNGAHLARSFLRPKGAAYKPDREQQLAALERQISVSTCDTGLISSEMFVFAEDAALTEFSQWLAARGIELKFFYYIREQVEFLSSSYIQQVKRHACTETAEKYILRVYQKIGHIKYSKFFDRLARFTGPDRIMCSNYDESRASAHGVCDAFVKTFGLDAGKLHFGETNVNVSLDLIETQIMLALNRFKPRMRFSDLVVENAARRGRKTVDLSHQLLSREILERLETYYAADNLRFARAYFGRDTLFAPRTAGNGNGALKQPDAEIALADVIDVFGGLLVRLDERLAALERRGSKPVAERDS